MESSRERKQGQPRVSPGFTGVSPPLYLDCPQSPERDRLLTQLSQSGDVFLLSTAQVSAAKGEALES